MSITIIRFSSAYKASLANLHQNGIKTGFLSTVGISFLGVLYQTIDRSPYSRIFIAVDDNRKYCVGFIACALSTSAMYRHIIVRYGVLFFVLLIPNLFRISNLKKILETLFYTRHKKETPGIDRKTDPCNAELLSIVVDENLRGQKIGKKLIAALERYFTENNIFAYNVVTYSKDTNANIFYQACGFNKQCEFMHHGNLMFEYSKTIK